MIYWVVSNQIISSLKIGVVEVESMTQLFIKNVSNSKFSLTIIE